MITIKQVEKDERWAFTVIKKFIKDHPIFLFFAGFILLIYIVMSLNIIMLLASVGGGMIEQNSTERLMAGDITPHDYIDLMTIMEIAAFLYGSISIGMRLVLLCIIFLLIYHGFKEYLKYKRDNL